MRVGSNTRVIIKNLPLSLDEKGVERLISDKCKELGLELTDCKLLCKNATNPKAKNAKNAGGKEAAVSRGLCFVGFADEKDATKFKEYYDGTYFRACKVTIEFSRPPPRTLPEGSDEPKKTERVVAKSKRDCGDGEVATTLVKQVRKYTKAGVSGERKHTVFEDNDAQSDSETGGSQTHDPEPPSDADEQEESTDNLDRVILFNLPYNVTEAAIRELCRPFGPITDIHLPLNRQNDADSDGGKLTKGYCYVSWVFPSDAVKFRDAKNRTIFCGRIMHVNLAKPKDNGSSGEAATYEEFSRRFARRNTEKSSYKREMQKKKLANAENATIWNTLHIDINATISAVSRQLELDKRDIVDEANAAVNVALSETLVLNKLTKWLDEQGVDYQQFQVSKSAETKDQDAGKDADSTENEVKRVTRSDDTLIVKNLPSDADEADLVEKFAKYGQLLRLAIAPYAVMGIVQYLEPKAAQAAFRGLAYTPYLGLPLYLEWAPVKLIREGAPVPALATKKKPAGKSAVEQPRGSEPPAAGDLSQEAEAEDDAEVSTNVSIYLKNLNFKTRDDALKNHFGSCRGYVSSKVVMKDNATLSRGFGFVEFDSLANAKAAIRAKTGLLIDGKVIEMSIAKRAEKPPAEIAESRILEATNKIIVKNLAFQATRQDLYKMFSYYGNVKSVRIPKSLKSNNRGFAFVEFLSKQESARAVEALQHTHLYGRHLVLEFAEEDPAEGQLAE
ncbi:RNA-binding protein P22H7.02c, putative [Babesia bigemina]|uniref:RNA-binding protein P22H7.02c, putative n=1 Tax=Babesia bigemina TaxID=5866 RepID=A0A061D325_BABBI|nr:RNA-binding protein P22H7.02c, putative [Babesia bigemina]CDR95018.1 RNA-binding protein P22H7.02c, putative [Babesia bigemina]|eukprot:XP_012767204.1 RNA-binding protein P22H7.02c, putative [Babesia bigemina]